MKLNDRICGSRAKPDDSNVFFFFSKKSPVIKEEGNQWLKKGQLYFHWVPLAAVVSWSDSSATAIQPHIKLWIITSCSNINNPQNQTISDTSPLAYYVIAAIFVWMGMCFPSPSWRKECQRLLSFVLFHCFALVLDCILHHITVFSPNWRIIEGADVFFHKPSVK